MLPEIKKLEEIKNTLEKAKIERANIQGQIRSKTEQLIEFGFEDTDHILEDVQDELDSLEVEREQLIADFEKKYTAFKKKYPKLFGN